MNSYERPGVYTSYEVLRGLRGSGSGNAVGLAAAADEGSAGTVTAITDQAAALDAFGGGNMTALVEILLENGAPVVYCCPVVSGDYDTAFDALMAVEEIKYMVCDSRTATVHGKLLDAIESAGEACRYRIGIVESGETSRSGLINAAALLNSEHMALVSHHAAAGTPGGTAAAVCGVLAGEQDPALPLNGAVLRGVGSIGSNFSDGDLTLLVRGGILPLETVGGKITVIRGITTRTTTGGAADDTWREINTVMIVNTVIPAIRDALRADFARAKNNARTRGAIRTRVIIELENYLQREIIDGYDDVTAQADAEDPTACAVSFGFRVTHGLNVITLSAHITV